MHTGNEIGSKIPEALWATKIGGYFLIPLLRYR